MFFCCWTGGERNDQNRPKSDEHFSWLQVYLCVSECSSVAEPEEKRKTKIGRTLMNILVGPKEQVSMALLHDRDRLCRAPPSSEHRLSAFTTLRATPVHLPPASGERAITSGMGFATPAPLMSVGMLHPRGRGSPGTTLPVFPTGAFLPAPFVDLPLTAALSGLCKYMYNILFFFLSFLRYNNHSFTCRHTHNAVVDGLE